MEKYGCIQESYERIFIVNYTNEPNRQRKGYSTHTMMLNYNHRPKRGVTKEEELVKIKADLMGLIVKIK